MSQFGETSAAESELLANRRSSLRLWPWLALLGVLAALLVWRNFGPPAADEEGNGRKHAAVGTRFTAITLQPLTGGGLPVAEADLAGKVTVINFWGPWCGYCKIEFPHLVELEDHYRSRSDFLFLSVSSAAGPQDDPTLREDTEHFLRQERATFRTLQDPGDQTKFALVNTARLDGFAFPTTVVLDKGSKIRGLWIGYRPGDERRLADAIESALRGEELPPATKK